VLKDRVEPDQPVVEFRSTDICTAVWECPATNGKEPVAIFSGPDHKMLAMMFCDRMNRAGYQLRSRTDAFVTGIGTGMALASAVFMAAIVVLG
jgi:hypothetical protein